MTILDQILSHKRKEIEEARALYPVKLLEKSVYFKASTVSLKKYLVRPDLHGVIAEFKRRSPSRGMINEFADPSKVCLGYMQAGASALSVLTESKYFGGSPEDLIAARNMNFCPVLRKDFVLDEYQVIESRSIGADAILLIAGVLGKEELKSLSGLARSLGMEVLFEIHRPGEMDLLPAEAEIIGVNSRNLASLSVDRESIMDMAGQLPASVVKVAESGIDSPEALLQLRRAGYQGFLIGEHFMKEANPADTCRQFIRKVKVLSGCKNIDLIT
jgi:indole-3-glycerol phosphate synthase